MSETHKGMTAAEWAYIADNQGAALLAITEALGCDDHEIIDTIEHLKAAALGVDSLRDEVKMLRSFIDSMGRVNFPPGGINANDLQVFVGSTKSGAQEAAAFMAGDRWMSTAEADAIRCDWPSVLDERGAEVE